MSRLNRARKAAAAVTATAATAAYPFTFSPVKAPLNS